MCAKYGFIVVAGNVVISTRAEQELHRTPTNCCQRSSTVAIIKLIRGFFNTILADFRICFFIVKRIMNLNNPARASQYKTHTKFIWRGTPGPRNTQGTCNLREEPHTEKDYPDPLVADSEPLVASSMRVFCARNSQREGRSRPREVLDHLFQWDVGISVGFSTGTIGSLRNPETRYTPSYTCRLVI